MVKSKLFMINLCDTFVYRILNVQVSVMIKLKLLVNTVNVFINSFLFVKKGKY